MPIAYFLGISLLSEGTLCESQTVMRTIDCGTILNMTILHRTRRLAAHGSNPSNTRCFHCRTGTRLKFMAPVSLCPSHGVPPKGGRVCSQLASPRYSKPQYSARIDRKSVV